MDEFIHGISGGLSGLIAATVWYPLETVRIRLQQNYLEQHSKIEKDERIEKFNLLKSKTEKEIKEGKEMREGDNKVKRRNSDTSSMTVFKKNEPSLIGQTLFLFRKIINEEGIRGLYSGISSCLVGSISSYGVYFYTYQFWKNFFIKHNLNRNVIFDSMCTSFLGALCTAISTNPIWVLNARMSQSKEKVSF